MSKLIVIFLVTLAATYGSWGYIVNSPLVIHVRNLKWFGKFLTMSFFAVALLSLVYIVF